MLPLPFVKRIQEQFADADQFLAAFSTQPVTSVRKHPIKGKQLDFGNEQVPWCKNGFYLSERPVFTLDPHLHAGAYYVQESSSMFIHTILEQLFEDKNIRVLDLCAAPGGKSTLIASWLDGNGLLVSNEVIRSRASILLENLIKWGYSNTWVTNTDVHILGSMNEFFDCILVDAPCSGEGLFRKDKDAIKEWSESNCDLCAGRQKKIIADILPALKTGGYCIYSTCTFNPGENDENLKWMLKNFPLELYPLDISLFPQIQSTEGGYAFYPHLNKGEGFYCCVLRKTDEIGSEIPVKRSKISWNKLTNKDFHADILVKNPDRWEWYKQNEKIFGVGKDFIDEWNQLTGITKVLGGFLSLGTMKGKDLVPDHALALSVEYNHYYPAVVVNKQDALYFLAKKDFKADVDQKGWHTIVYESSILGFAKILDNRINNYYPSEWRIRMDI